MRYRGVGFPNHGVDDQGWRLYITSLVMILTAGLFVIARCVARLVRHNFGWDDWTIVVSLAFSIVLSIAIQLAVTWGYGMHKVDLAKDELEMCLKWFFIAQTPYKVVVCLNKVSVILLYLRIFVSNYFRIAAFVVMFIVVGYGIGGIGATIWQCVPIEGAWLQLPGEKCIDSGMFWVAYAVLNILTDVMVLALPILPIVRLQLRWRDRFLLCGVFTLGGFVTITSILRVTSVQNSLHNRADQTFNFIERGIWTLIEANLGIVSACLPVLKQPLGVLFPRLFGTVKGSTTKGSAAGPHESAASHGRWRRTADDDDEVPKSSGGGSSVSKAGREGGGGGGGGNGNWSAVSAGNRSNNPRFWRGPLKHELNVSISAARGGGQGQGDDGRRGSDERHIIGASDQGSDTIELDERGGSGGSGGSGLTVGGGGGEKRGRGINKTVELTRTSFHEARATAHAL